MTVTGIFTWLGGGRPTEVTEGHEQASYALAGVAVTLFAAVTGLVTVLALAATGGWPAPGIAAIALVAALLAGTIGRALATRKPGGVPDRLGLGARIGVAALSGALIAELACTVLFGGTVDRLLDERAQRDAESAPAVVTARAETESARADRAALDRAVTTAQADIDRTLVIARCEFNPTAECPQTRITGVPGRGPEAATANAMLDDARGRLAAAQGRVDAADLRVTEAEKVAAAAGSAAFAEADRGLGARWQAMNDYTAGPAGALLLRALTMAAFVLFALLPLILRWWRGETSLDRRAAFHTVQERAEFDADTAIALERARVRAEVETLRAEQQLTAARLAAEADTAIDRERQRTRIIAAVGGLELGVTEPRRLGDGPRRAELPAGDTASEEEIVRPNLPAPVDAGTLAPAVPAPPPEVTPKGGIELPIIGQVPFSDTAARWIRPLVPAFVADAIDTATHPLRTARQAFEEVEEITFTLRRTRKVTIDTQESHPGAIPGNYQLDSSGTGHAEQVAATVVDADYSTPRDPRHPALPTATAGGYDLPRGTREHELAASNRSELTGRRGPRELPPGR
ncbi:DUF4407 domain-containing protein [Nocardia sp. NPDC005366]|uniref:DUF4407 domain-containing protein n=1 Tax=Nocardia sp. NPDC005366 TaxID=3156878 RepID=UPI0033A931C1